jgi:spore maturation protein CgeB
MKPKKILLVVPDYSSFYFPIKQALDKDRIKSVLFDNRKTVFREKIVFAFSKIIPSLRQLGVKMINRRFKKLVKRTKPDLILVVKGENLEPSIIKEIAERTVILNWFPDFLPDFMETEEWLRSYTALFIGDSYEVNLYQKKGFNNIFYLPYAAPLISYPSKNKKYDVVFIGVYNKQRERMFWKLRDLNFKIWGDTKWGSSRLAENYMGRWLSYKETLKTLGQSKIVVNYHQHRFPKNTMLNLRVYEALVSKTLLITDERIDLSHLFGIGREVVVYRTPRELRKKVSHYLSNTSERERIAVAGFKKVSSKHTYEQRMNEIYKVISALSKFQ